MNEAAPMSLFSSMDQIENSMGAPSVQVKEPYVASSVQPVAVVTPAKPQPPLQATPQVAAPVTPAPLQPKDEEEGEEYTEDEIDDEKATISCNRIRQMINEFLATKEMTVTEFLREIGVSSSSPYQRFMKLKGTWNGTQNSTYWGAQRFFKLRALRQKKAVAAEKKAAKQVEKDAKNAAKQAAKTSGVKRTHADMSTPSVAPSTPAPAPAAVPMVSPANAASPPALPPSHPSLSFHVPDAIFSTTSPLVPLSAERNAVQRRGEELVRLVRATAPSSFVSVYDDCDEIRRKIAVITQSNCISKGAFYEAIGTQSTQVNKFLSKKGPDQGAGLAVYPRAYRFFENLRIALNQPKTSKRKSNESKHPTGFKLENPRPIRYLFIPGAARGFPVQF